MTVEMFYLIDFSIMSDGFEEKNFWLRGTHSRLSSGLRTERRRRQLIEGSLLVKSTQGFNASVFSSSLVSFDSTYFFLSTTALSRDWWSLETNSVHPIRMLPVHCRLVPSIVSSLLALSLLSFIETRLKLVIPLFVVECFHSVDKFRRVYWCLYHHGIDGCQSLASDWYGLRSRADLLSSLSKAMWSQTSPFSGNYSSRFETVEYPREIGLYIEDAWLWF